MEANFRVSIGTSGTRMARFLAYRQEYAREDEISSADYLLIKVCPSSFVSQRWFRGTFH